MSYSTCSKLELAALLAVAWLGGDAYGFVASVWAGVGVTTRPEPA